MRETRRATISHLRAKLSSTIHHLENAELAGEIGPLSRVLGSAWRPGGTVELCGPEPATFTLAVWLAARRDGPTVLIDSAGSLFPYALRSLGLNPQQMASVRPREGRLALWAMEQSLRCPAVAATLCRLGPRLATTAARRLKLAAEVGGGVGLLIRPAAREPPFADARLQVRPVRSEGTDTLRPRWEVESLYIRNGREGLKCVVEVTADARLVLVPSELVRSAGPRRRIGG